jgi:hypothetical protein
VQHFPQRLRARAENGLLTKMTRTPRSVFSLSVFQVPAKSSVRTPPMKTLFNKTRKDRAPLFCYTPPWGRSIAYLLSLLGSSCDNPSRWHPMPLLPQRLSIEPLHNCTARTTTTLCSPFQWDGCTDTMTDRRLDVDVG